LWSDVTEPMLAKLVGQLPRPDACPGGCLYEPKWDGFRCVARIDERPREIGGDTPIISEVVRQLRPHEFLFLGNKGDVAQIVKVGRRS
jgi:hypothetical protein